MQMNRKVRYTGRLLALLVMAACSQAMAIEFTGPDLYGDQVTGTLNTTITMGTAWRMQSRAADLIGKSNLNPNVCTGPNGAFQQCQGLFKDQIYPAQELAKAPGTASVNGDDGDLNYGKGNIVQAVTKLTSDLTLNYKNFGLFGRALYFYDAANDNKTEYHPNEITQSNYLSVGRHVPIPPGGILSGIDPSKLVGCLTNPLNNGCLANSVVQGLILNNRIYGRPDGHGNDIVYGPGGGVRNKRSDPEVLREAGTDVQLLDLYLFGKVPLPFGEGKDLTVKVGRQVVNWGESTTLVINSLNQTNPVNANNYYRVGNQVEEDYIPLNMIDVAFEPFTNTSLEMYYAFEWQPIQAPAPGTYFSDQDAGTHNARRSLGFNIGAGGAAEDPNNLGHPLDNPLAVATPTGSTLERLPDGKARSMGQFGIKLGYYADWLNGGTDLAFYAMNYHSTLPYASFYAAYPGCARREGNAQHNDANNTLAFFSNCNKIPLLKSLTGDTSPETSSVGELDSVKVQLEYPEDIHLIGASFNTNVGDMTLQGEVAYRPNLPLQVDTQDLGFAALGPTLSRCHDPKIGCVGSTVGVGFTQDGGTALYGPSDFTPSAGKTGYHDTFDLIEGAMGGSARSFPNFIIPYRGGTVGENTPCYPKPGSAEDVAMNMNGFSHPYYPYNDSSPCYIRGYERMQVFEVNFGTTKILGPTDNPLGATQIILATEVGATYVPFMPPLDQLVLEGPNTNWGPTAGADGSGANGSRMACSTIPDCSLGPDGARFNAHQQDPSGYPDPFSWGYRLIAQFKYESVLPGLSVSPFLIYRQDVQGTSPSPAPNFVAGRKETDLLTEFRYKGSLSLNLGYTWYWGGGSYNTLSDRDFAQAFFKYQF